MLESPNGLGVNDTTVTLSFTNAFATSNLTVQAANDCNPGTSNARSITITRNNPATPGLISGPTNACEFIAPGGTPASYTIAAVTNADPAGYNWTFSFSPVGLTGQGTTSISFTYPNGFTSGTISVTSSNGCGTSGIRTLSISKLNPATPSVIDVIQTQPCPNREYSYTLAGMPANATSINWTWPGAATYVSGQGTTSLVLSYPGTAVSGTVTATAVSNCGSSSVRTSSVKLPACAGRYTEFTKGNMPVNMEAMNVNVFPNPTSTDFKLQVITAGSEQIDVRIMDLQGRSFKQLTVMPYQTVNIGAGLKAGAYMLEIIQGINKTTKRILKI